MSDITIYTAALCGYCRRAKRLLDQKGVDYHEIDVTFAPQDRAKMRERANGQNTVPQIFFGSTHIGGSDDLMELEQDGELDRLLAEHVSTTEQNTPAKSDSKNE